MASQPIVTQWIGQHRHVVPERHFLLDDPEERVIDGLRCLDCRAFQETRHELVAQHPECRAA